MEKVTNEIKNGMSIYDRISAIMEGVGAIQKTQFNNQTGKNFRGKEDFLKAFQPYFQMFGVTMGFDIKEFREEAISSPIPKNPDRIFFRTTIWANVKFSCETGSVGTDVLVSKNDFGDFGAISAMSFAITKALEIVFCVPTEEPHIPQIEASKEAVVIPELGLTKSDIDSILDSIYDATADELKVIWDSNPDFQRWRWFTNPIKDRKKELADEAVSKLPHDQKKTMKDLKPTAKS